MVKNNLKQNREKESENENKQKTNQEETIGEVDIEEEVAIRSDPEEFISLTEPMMRENDEEPYEEGVFMTSHFSSERN